MSIFDVFRKNGNDETEEQKPKPTITLAEVLEDYRKDFELRGCKSAKSLRSEMKVLNLYFGELPADKLTLAMLREFQSKQRSAGLACATVNKQLAVLRAAIQLAAETEKLESVPAWPKRLRTAKPRQGFLERQDHLAIRDALPGPWAQDVLDFAMWAGWRKNEILGLTWGEVDLGALQVRLDGDRSKNGETRVIPLMSYGLEAIQRRALERLPGVERVFTREDGRTAIASTTWHYVWADATAKAGLPHQLFHDIRRTCVRNLELSGVPRAVAMSWVGHKTHAVYQRYAIVVEKDLIPAARKLLATVLGQKRDESDDDEKDERAARLRVVERFKPPTLEDEKLYE